MWQAARLRSVRRGRTCPQVFENRKFYDHFQEVIHRCGAVDKVLTITSNVPGKLFFTPVYNYDRRRKILWTTTDFQLINAIAVTRRCPVSAQPCKLWSDAQQPRKPRGGTRLLLVSLLVGHSPTTVPSCDPRASNSRANCAQKGRLP